MQNNKIRCLGIAKAVAFFVFFSISSNVAIASHFRVESTFDALPIGWTEQGGTITAGSPFGGNYLAYTGLETDAYGVFVLDALPAGTYDEPSAFSDASRLALVTFDLIGFDPLTENFNVQASTPNTSYSFILDASDTTSGSGLTYSFIVEFVLSPVGGCCTDLDVTFSSLSSGAWGIDNVVVDWGRVVPIPGAAWFFVSAFAGLAGWRNLAKRK